LGIGPLVRRAFGRHERLISEAYRRIFVDLDDFIVQVRTHVATPGHVLEIGCGEGAVTERLAVAFPESALTGIDICAEPGRLYRGDRSRARFLRARAIELSGSERAKYQLVIISDVMHHVPRPEWEVLLSSARDLSSAGGTLILKEWVRQWTPAYTLGYLSDRFITGDRIHYPGESELRLLAQNAFGLEAIRSAFRVRPWRCNFALVISPAGSRQGGSRSVE
jgi:2-polyprenyl-3-methyl-5-hydroxy-6-metoxy-1,4-benzoquinol methylase